MPTEVISTIGSGGTYSTLQAWEDACPANLVTDDKVWIGEVLSSGIIYSVGSFGAPALTVSGITTDATRYVWLRAATGASFKDHIDKRTNALRYNEANGAFIRINTPYAACINISSSYFRMTGLQWRGISPNNYGFTIDSAGAIIEDCIFGNQYQGGLSIGQRTIQPTVRNCLVYSESGDAGIGIYPGAEIYKGAVIVNCTIVRPSSLGASGAAINISYGQNVTIDNVAIFNWSATAPITGNFPSTWTVRNCATSGSSLGDPFGTSSNNLLNLTYADQFEAATPAASMDFRLKTGSSLVDAGRSTASNGVSADITGMTRSGSYDIGAWEALTGPHDLFATSITTGAPVVSSALLSLIFNITTSGITLGAPILGVGSLSQTHVLVANSLVVGTPTVGVPYLNRPATPINSLRLFTLPERNRAIIFAGRSRDVALSSRNRTLSLIGD